MNSQQQILRKLKQLEGKKTLDQYSRLTGIERTRFFRLQQGFEMKLGEYEKILKVIHHHDKTWSPISTDVSGLSSHLNGEMGKELWEGIDRLIRYKKMIKTTISFAS